MALNSVLFPTMCACRVGPKARTAITTIVFAVATAAVAVLPWVAQHQMLIAEESPDAYDAETRPSPNMVAVAAIAVVVFLFLECLILCTTVRIPLYFNAILVAAGAALAPPYFAYALQANRYDNTPQRLELWLLLGVPAGLALAWAFVKIHEQHDVYTEAPYSSKSMDTITPCAAPPAVVAATVMVSYVKDGLDPANTMDVSG